MKLNKYRHHTGAHFKNPIDVTIAWMVFVVFIICTLLGYFLLPSPFGVYSTLCAIFVFALILILSDKSKKKPTSGFFIMIFTDLWYFIKILLFKKYRLETLFYDLDNLPIAILFISHCGRITMSNSAARKLLNIKPNEHPKFTDLIQGLGRSVAQWLEFAYYSQQKAQPEIMRAKRAKNDLYLQVSLTKLNIGDGSQLMAILNDSTELKTLEAQFVQSQKMQAIGELAGGIAHDFNNLLTAINGYCDLLKIRFEKNDQDYGDLMQISQNANRAAALVKQLLAFSRKQNLQPKALQVNDVVSNLGHMLKRLLSENICLSFNYAKILPDAYVDSGQLEQVIVNLVVNARDAIENQGNIRIKTRLMIYIKNTLRDNVFVLSGRYVCIEVQDNGIGIKKENMDKIFEPFYSTKKANEGTGLGLSTIYGIIKQTGGYIFVNSKEAVGTNFPILLPVAQQKSANVKEKKPSRVTSLKI